jgi:hypothetical protein
MSPHSIYSGIPRNNEMHPSETVESDMESHVVVSWFKQVKHRICVSQNGEKSLKALSNSLNLEFGSIVPRHSVDSYGFS